MLHNFNTEFRIKVKLFSFRNSVAFSLNPPRIYSMQETCLKNSRSYNELIQRYLKVKVPKYFLGDVQSS